MLLERAARAPHAVAVVDGGVELTFADLVHQAGMLAAHLQRVGGTGTLNIGAFFFLLFVAAYHLPGGVAALVGSVQPVIVIVLTKRWRRPVGVLLFTGWQLTAGGLVLLLVEGLPAAVDGDAVLGFGYLAVVGSLLGYSVWFRGADRVPAVAMSFLGFVSPILAIQLSPTASRPRWPDARRRPGCAPAVSTRRP